MSGYRSRYHACCTVPDDASFRSALRLDLWVTGDYVPICPVTVVVTRSSLHDGHATFYSDNKGFFVGLLSSCYFVVSTKGNIGPY